MRAPGTSVVGFAAVGAGSDRPPAVARDDHVVVENEAHDRAGGRDEACELAILIARSRVPARVVVDHEEPRRARAENRRQDVGRACCAAVTVTACDTRAPHEAEPRADCDDPDLLRALSREAQKEARHVRRCREHALRRAYADLAPQSARGDESLCLAVCQMSAPAHRLELPHEVSATPPQTGEDDPRAGPL